MSVDRPAKPARRQKKPWLPIVAAVLTTSAGYYHFVKLTRSQPEAIVTVASIGAGQMDPEVKRRLRAEFGDRIAFQGDSGSEPESTQTASTPAPAPATPPLTAPPAPAHASASTPEPAPSMQVARIDPAPQSVPAPVESRPPEVPVNAPQPGTAAVGDKPAKPRAAAPRSAGAGAKKAKTPVAEPVTVAALFSKAGAEVSNGAVNRAIELAREILKLEPDHQPALQMLMALLVEQGQTREVRSLVSERIERGRATVDHVMVLARLVLETGDDGGALAVLERSAALGATSAPYRGFTGALLHRAGRLEEAAREFAAATKLAPGGASYWLALGSVHEARGAPAEAAPAYRRAKTAAGLSAAQIALVDRRLAALDVVGVEASVASSAAVAQ